jgi:DnaJ-class molecular chaperone
MTDTDADQSGACFYCEGKGTVECSTCFGRGGRNAHRYKPVGFDYRKVEGSFEWVTCVQCDGTGKVECPECLGGELP